jgi:hypothetical protein
MALPLLGGQSLRLFDFLTGHFRHKPFNNTQIICSIGLC